MVKKELKGNAVPRSTECAVAVHFEEYTYLEVPMDSVLIELLAFAMTQKYGPFPTFRVVRQRHEDTYHEVFGMLSYGGVRIALGGEETHEEDLDGFLSFAGVCFGGVGVADVGLGASVPVRQLLDSLGLRKGPAVRKLLRKHPYLTAIHICQNYASRGYDYDAYLLADGRVLCIESFGLSDEDYSVRATVRSKNPHDRFDSVAKELTLEEVQALHAYLTSQQEQRLARVARGCT